MTVASKQLAVTGTAYGLALNDKVQRQALASAFVEPPYKAEPLAPVLYIKPRTCFGFGGAPVSIPAELEVVTVAATVGLLFRKDLTKATSNQVRSALAGACLALDVSEPNESFYRPAIRQMCRDGFLPLGKIGDVPQVFADIITEFDGREVHRWSLESLVRNIETAAAEISAFMTFRAGDLLLVGLPGDAPRAGPGTTVTVRSEGLATLQAALVREPAQ